MSCLSDNLILAAIDLIDANKIDEVTDAHVRRSISTTYFALFQHICCEASDLFLGTDDSELTRAKEHMRRSISHEQLAKRCSQAYELKDSAGNYVFPDEIRNMANGIVQAKEKRHDADYSFRASFTKVDALLATMEAGALMEDFDGLAKNHRKAFMVWALVNKNRK